MNKPDNDGGPAFPLQDWDPAIQSPRRENGMSLREWFAGMALQPTITDAAKFNHIFRENGSPTRITPDDVAKSCYIQADAMLAARKRKEIPQLQPTAIQPLTSEELVTMLKQEQP